MWSREHAFDGTSEPELAQPEFGVVGSGVQLLADSTGMMEAPVAGSRRQTMSSSGSSRLISVGECDVSSSCVKDDAARSRSTKMSSAYGWSPWSSSSMAVNPGGPVRGARRGWRVLSPCRRTHPQVDRLTKALLLELHDHAVRGTGDGSEHDLAQTGDDAPHLILERLVCFRGVLPQVEQRAGEIARVVGK